MTLIKNKIKKPIAIERKSPIVKNIFSPVTSAKKRLHSEEPDNRKEDIKFNGENDITKIF
ncbi:hypothetical protein DZJ_33970 [Dickeya ananatis]